MDFYSKWVLFSSLLKVNFYLKWTILKYKWILKFIQENIICEILCVKAESRDCDGSVVSEGRATKSCISLVIHLQRLTCSDGKSTGRD